MTTNRSITLRTGLLILTVASLTGCAGASLQPDPALPALPDDDRYCLAAQRLVTRTTIPMKLEVQADFNGFVKSKALIEGPTIQQYDWRDDSRRLLGISCKLKNTDHLVARFGPASAGPDGTCQDMNRAVYALVARDVPNPRFRRVAFDPQETVINEKEPGMTGPDWLAPFTLTAVDADGVLRIFTKGFIVNFNDPRLAAMPERFRGVHYCHFIAPAHLRALLEGKAQPGVTIGRKVDPVPPPDVPRPPSLH